jgi:hypothetical protein
MDIKYTNISHCKIYPNFWDFWFENKPSGIPGQDSSVYKWLFWACEISQISDIGKETAP